MLSNKPLHRTCAELLYPPGKMVGMSKYSEMVQALARARERGEAVKDRVEKVQEMIEKAIGDELGTKKSVVTSTDLKAQNAVYYLPEPGNNTTFRNQLAVRVEDEDEASDEPCVTFTFEMSYSVLIVLAVDEEPRGVNVAVNGRQSVLVTDAQTALHVAQTIVRSCEAAVGRAGNTDTVRPSITAEDPWPSY